jgi:hypothetical protein
MAAGVEGGERFVEQEHGGIGGQGSGQGDPLGLPTGQLGGTAVGEFGESDAFQPWQGLLAGDPAPGAADLGGERDVVQHAQVREQPVVLEHQPDRPVRRG